MRERSSLREGIAPFTGADIVDPALAIVPCARVPITACTLGEAAREIVRLATSELALGLAVRLCNAYTLALADKDPAYLAMPRAASLNFPDGTPVAGTKRQAPLWMQRTGLGWAHRLLSEPRRQWKRYLFGNARFVYAAACRRGS